MDLLYINVYAVTQHYGGGEEGGWWFLAGEPLASVPVKAERKRGCGRHCWQCKQAELETMDESGQTMTFCRSEPTEDDEQYAENLSEYKRKLFFTTLQEKFHFTPANFDDIKRRKAELMEMFAHENHGKVTQADGRGREVEIRIEDHMAQAWPQRRPHYE
jgi:hypothetical protein